MMGAAQGPRAGAGKRCRAEAPQGRSPAARAWRSRVPEVAGSCGQPARASANSRRFPRGVLARGRRRGHRRQGNKSPGGGADVWGQRLG